MISLLANALYTESYMYGFCTTDSPEQVNTLEGKTFVCPFSCESEVSSELNVVFLGNVTESFSLVWIHRCFAAQFTPLKLLSAAERLKTEHNVIICTHCQ